MRALPLLLGGAAVMLAAAPAGALETFTELAPDSSSAISARVGPGIGLARLPRTFSLAADYDLTLNGPLQLDVGVGLGLAGDVFALQLAPGIRYLLPLAGLTWIPYGKAALALDVLGGSGSAGTDLVVGLKLAVGLQYFFHRSLAVGPELGCTTGLAAGDDGSGGAFRADATIAVTYRMP